MRPQMCRFVFAIAFAATTATANAGDWELPSDVGVTLTALPTNGLVPGQLVDMTLSVTNYGTEELPVVITDSSFFVDEIYLSGFNIEECFVFTLVLDLANGGYEYLLDWDVASAYAGTAPALQPGETRVCHFQIVVTSSLPAVYPFSFGLPASFHDPNPTNDRATVVLERAGAPSATPVPTLSPAVISLLAVVLALVGAVAYLRQNRTAARQR